jgi:hypothetical protein
MNVQKLVTTELKEKVVKLVDLTPGDVMRFTHDSYEDALEHDLFYIVGSSKDKRVKLFSPKNGTLIERDDDWRVIKHNAVLSIEPNI